MNLKLYSFMLCSVLLYSIRMETLFVQISNFIIHITTFAIHIPHGETFYSNICLPTYLVSKSESVKTH